MGHGIAPRNPLWVWRDLYREIVSLVRSSSPVWRWGPEGIMGKEGPCRHCGVTSELLFLNKARNSLSLSLSLSLLFCSPFPLCSLASFTFQMMISPNYASGKRALDNIFELRRTGIPHLSVFFVRSLMVIITLDSLNCQECSRDIFACKIQNVRNRYTMLTEHIYSCVWLRRICAS